MSSVLKKADKLNLSLCLSTEIQCEIGGHLGFFNDFCPFTHIIMV